jgi:hypothetical protein
MTPYEFGRVLSSVGQSTFAPRWKGSLLYQKAQGAKLQPPLLRSSGRSQSIRLNKRKMGAARLHSAMQPKFEDF